MHWVYLSIAVVANIATNLLLKKTMNSIHEPFGMDLLWQAILSPWLWSALVTGFLLLGSYLLAIRTLELSLSYATVTSAALVGITILSTLLFGDTLTIVKIIGIISIIFGLILIIQ